VAYLSINFAPATADTSALRHVTSSREKMADHQDDDEDVLCEIAMAAAVVAVTASSELIKRNKRKRRTMWVRPMFQKRCELGAYNMLMAELRESDTGRYHGFTRLTVEDFDELLSIVKDDIAGSSRFRVPIPPDVKLAVTVQDTWSYCSRLYVSLSVCLSVHLFSLYFRNRLIVDLELLHVSIGHDHRRSRSWVEVTACLVESNGNLPPNLWRDSLHVTCSLYIGISSGSNAQ